MSVNIGYTLLGAMLEYYARRAAEYEGVYAKPERQEDLKRLRAIVASDFDQRDVLEVSCGTGYWTETLAKVCRSVKACDINDEVLEIARAKTWEGTDVQFIRANSYALPEFGTKFSGAFAGFWWSHIPRRRIREFLNHLTSKLEPGALVMLFDNRYVEGSSTPIARTDSCGDTYQMRWLCDGSSYEVLKNFPTEQELLEAVDAVALDREVILLPYFWILRFRAKPSL